MAKSASIIRQEESTINAIRESKLSLEMQDDIVNMVSEAAEATNGLSHEEKLQAVSVNQFNMARFIAAVLIKLEDHTCCWKEVLVQCKWAIVVICLIIAVLLLFHPELANNIEHIARRGD